VAHKERLAELRKLLKEAQELEIASPDLAQQILIQTLNGAEEMRQKAGKEMQRLQHQMGEVEGKMKAADLLSDLVVNIVGAYNTQERKRRQEDKELRSIEGGGEGGEDDEGQSSAAEE